jgi:hypothetical protein
MLANTIDDVVNLLDGIITASVASDDRRGYFAALYNRVTQRVRAGVQAGEFEDNPRMAKFDVAFANRYFEAYDAYAGGGQPTRPWRRAFDAAKRDDLLVLQHLLLAMTTHITLDLGIAAATVAPGAALPGLRKDFLHINQLLSEETALVESELVEIAGAARPPLGRLLELFEDAAHGYERTAAGVLIDVARARAWDMAVKLVDAPDQAARDAVVAHQERDTTLLVDAVLLGEPAVALVGGGSLDVAGNIKVLARGELPL